MTLNPIMSSLSVNGKHCYAACWKIERTDGVTLLYTEHNRPITLGADTYVPGNAGLTSARQHTSGVEPQNVEIRGTVFDDALTEDDLAAGKYRNAKVTETVVDWRFPWAGTFDVNVFYVEETVFDGEKWVAKLLGVKMKLQTKVGFQYTRTCRYKLGDADCGVDLDALTVSGTVSAVLTPRKKFETSLTASNGVYALGSIRFTSGANAGAGRFDVKSYLSADGVVELQIQTPKAVAAGDAFDITPGCDHRAVTCDDTYGNKLRFGGYPTIPGNDQALLTPDVRPPQ